HRRVAERIRGEPAQFADGAADVVELCEALGPLNDGLRSGRMVGELLAKELVVDGTRRLQDFLPFRRLRLQGGEAVQTVAELEQGIAGLRSRRLGADK